MNAPVTLVALVAHARHRVSEVSNAPVPMVTQGAGQITHVPSIKPTIARIQPAGRAAVCTDTGLNSFSCQCSDGYTGGGANTPCVDIDECTSDPCGVGGTCSTPSVGSFNAPVPMVTRGAGQIMHVPSIKPTIARIQPAGRAAAAPTLA